MVAPVHRNAPAVVEHPGARHRCGDSDAIGTICVPLVTASALRSRRPMEALMGEAVTNEKCLERLVAEGR